MTISEYLDGPSRGAEGRHVVLELDEDNLPRTLWGGCPDVDMIDGDLLGRRIGYIGPSTDHLTGEPCIVIEVEQREAE